MTTIPLPFERGTTYDSGTMGAVRPGLMGARFVAKDGTELQIVRNDNGATIYGCQACSYMNPHVSNAVELTASDNERDVAGFADHKYAEKGNTIPDGALFYVVKKGDMYVRAGAGCVPGEALRTDAGASALAEGRVQPFVAGLSNNIVMGAAFGVFLATGVAASVINTGSVLARVHCP